MRYTVTLRCRNCRGTWQEQAEQLLDVVSDLREKGCPYGCSDGGVIDMVDHKQNPNPKDK